jgi:hypothetical protein
MLIVSLTALAVTAGALAVAGCGGSSKGAATSAASTPSSSSSTQATTVAQVPPTTTIAIASGTPLSRTAWIAKADAICAHANTKIEANTIKSTQEFATILPQVALYDKTEAAELSQLVPPPSKTNDWKQIVDGLQLFGEYTSRVAEYAQAKNFAAAQPITLQGEKTHKQFVAIAKRDGFKDCAVL